MNKQFLSSSTALVLLISALPGCGFSKWFGATKESSEQVSHDIGEGNPVAWMDGKPIVTDLMVEEGYQNFAQSNPQISLLLSLKPELETEIKDQVLESLIAQHTIGKYIEAKGLNTTDDYKHKMQEIIKGAQQMLNVQVFRDQFPVNVSDAEIKKFYEDHKAEFQGLADSCGGVTTAGISFEKEADAKAFFDKVKDAPAKFDEMAKAAGHAEKIKDFKLIHASSVGIDTAIRSKVLSLTAFPAVAQVTGDDKKHWVIVARSREEATYKPYEKLEQAIKEELRDMVSKDKEQQEFKRILDEKQREYNVTKKSFAESQKEQDKVETMDQMNKQDVADQPKEEAKSRPAPKATRAA